RRPRDRQPRSRRNQRPWQPCKGLLIRGLRQIYKVMLEADWLNKNIQGPATDQAGIVLGILIEIESQRARLLGLHHLPRRLPHLSLDAATPDCPNNRPVIAHQHLGGFERRNRPTHVNDGGNGAAPALLAKLYDLLVNVHPVRLSAG